jgi:hypothetical protein
LDLFEIYRNLAAAIPSATSHDPESEKAILDREVLTLGHADNFPPGKRLMSLF